MIFPLRILLSSPRKTFSEVIFYNTDDHPESANALAKQLQSDWSLSESSISAIENAINSFVSLYTDVITTIEPHLEDPLPQSIKVSSLSHFCLYIFFICFRLIFLLLPIFTRMLYLQLHFELHLIFFGSFGLLYDLLALALTFYN